VNFKNKDDKRDKCDILLEPRSLVVLTDEARYNWTHGIPAREKDKWMGNTIYRKPRISLTYRRVILIGE
jgi:alkylated DNA repair dioxygenase AlkB